MIVTSLFSLSSISAEQTNLAGDKIEIINDDVNSNLTADPIESFINNNVNDADYNASSQDDLWARIRSGFAIPNIDSEYTTKYETWYSSRPDYVKRMLERSQKYLFHIVEEVEKRNMPSEIALLPMIESAYNPQAYSRSHAAGIWQFVPATGKDFGLKQNYWSDKRRDVTAATDAALTYLQKLHGMFGSWDLALAAYNAGEGTVSRAIERNRRKGLPTDYQSLDLPSETKNYVPKLQAIKNIVFNPNQYGLQLVDIPNRPYFTQVLAPKQIDAALAAKLANISDEEFAALNPSYNRPVIVSNNEVHQLLLPTWAADQFRENLANYDKPLTSWKSYQAKRGERIDYIARKFDINASELREVNNLSSSSKMNATRPILVPNNEGEESNLLLTNFKTVNAPQSSNEQEIENSITYKVKHGDTVSSLASKFHVDSRYIIRTNQLKSKKLKAGQLIKISSQHAGKVNASNRYKASKKNVRISSKSKARTSKVSAKRSHQHTRKSSRM
ncbi:MAG: transglycosylase SLT domain-containing protein [Methylophilus sp.]|nr:transglycosylase SLT domain-containing protein [Methylophilus sp.]